MARAARKRKSSRKTTAKKSVRKPVSQPVTTTDQGLQSLDPFANENGDFEETGSYLVLLEEGDEDDGLRAIEEASGLADVCHSGDFEASAVDMVQASTAEVFVLDELGIAVVNTDPNQAASMVAAVGEQRLMHVEAERVMRTQSPIPAGILADQLEYVRGYRDAVNHLYSALSGEIDADGDTLNRSTIGNTRSNTWGLRATGVDRSRFSGRGVRVAVLDTGMDLRHPDFVDRGIVHNSRSFVAGETVQDENGHGTHCIGTSLGPSSPVSGVRRYGCAFGAEIFAGKVLSNAGSGADRGILAGINWAITNECRIISMSLGARVRPGEPPSRVYETIANRALNSDPGALIVAAAGNSSRRPDGTRREPPNPVGRPANCPSIMAVAAVDSELRIAPFSDGGINPDGGNVDIAGPGVNVFSSYPVSKGSHASLSGTSMATPHVAGIGAAWLEAHPGTTAKSLFSILTNNAKRLSIPARDVGAGLVQAP